MSDKSISTTSPAKTGTGNGTQPSTSPGATPSLTDDVKGLGSDVKGIASDVAREAQKMAESQLDSGRERVAEGMGSVAGAIRNTGDQLRGSPVAGVADYLTQAADTVQGASKYLENKSVGEVVSDVESFARREPLIFLGGTFAVGLLLGRFLKSASPAATFRDDRLPEMQGAGKAQGRDGGYGSSQPSRDGRTGASQGSYGTQGVSRDTRPMTSSYNQGSSMTGNSTMGGQTTSRPMTSSQGLPPTQGSAASASTVKPATPHASTTAPVTTPMTTGPLTKGPMTTGPVSTASSVGTDLPVNPADKPAGTGGATPSTSGAAKRNDV